MFASPSSRIEMCVFCSYVSDKYTHVCNHFSMILKYTGQGGEVKHQLACIFKLLFISMVWNKIHYFVKVKEVRP